MKERLYFYLLIFCPIVCFGQITITNNYFPTGGDSLVTALATAQTVRNITISKATTVSQNWDYSFLRATTPNTRIVGHFKALNPLTDTAILREFPTATLTATDTIGQISVYRRTATRFDLLGYFNANFAILPIGLRPKFEPPSLERRAVLTYNSTNSNKTGFTVPFSTNIIPDTFFALLPIHPDSLRIRFVSNRQDRVDAFGKVRIPGSGDLDCLRERRYEITETHIDAKSNNFPIWIDITNLFPTTFIRTRDTILTFNFWSDAYKEPLLTIRADNDSMPTSAQYKWFPINVSTLETESPISANLFPMPADQVLYVNLNQLPAADYTLTVVDYRGRLVFTQKLKTTSDKVQLQFDTHNWTSGLYFLNLNAGKEGVIHLKKTLMIQH